MAERSPRMLELTRRLVERTKAGQITWNQNRDLPSSFETRIADATITIRSQDPDGNQPFELALWRQGDPDEAGSRQWIQVEKLTDADSVAGAEPGWATRLAELWRLARGKALRVDDAIEQVLAALA